MEFSFMERFCRLSIRRLNRALVLHAAIPILLFAGVSFQMALGTRPPASANAGTAFSFTERVGWFHGPCLAIANQHLAQGTSLALVVMGKPQKVMQAQSLEQTTDPTRCEALTQGRTKMNAKPGISFYALETGSVEPTDMGIGLVEPPARPDVVKGLVRADLNQDGQREVFSSCATSEGITFAVWTGKAYQGEPLWSGYYYLGYDLRPTCP
jgi:hypothetical protein